MVVAVASGAGVEVVAITAMEAHLELLLVLLALEFLLLLSQDLLEVPSVAALKVRQLRVARSLEKSSSS